MDESDRRRVLALLTSRGRAVYRSLQQTLKQRYHTWVAAARLLLANDAAT